MLDTACYTVGWICAVTTEYVASRQFLDEEHDQHGYIPPPGDNNAYTFGTIGRHHIVMAVMPRGEYGLTSAATVAKDMFRSFPSVKIGLMVGIGGGAPTAKHDIRLGDVVVSSPGAGKGGVYQYDYGKAVQHQKFKQTGYLNEPPAVLLAAISDLAARFEEKGHDIETDIELVLARHPRLRHNYQRPDLDTDCLFEESFIHPDSSDDSCHLTCAKTPSTLAQRPTRDAATDIPVIHYGCIASANQLMKDASLRNALAKDAGVLCFEMEAAGLMNQFPFLVVRGICDYADSHKNKMWQGYAAMAASAYTRKLLLNVPHFGVADTRLALRPARTLSSDFHQRSGRRVRRMMVPLAQNPLFTGRQETVTVMADTLFASVNALRRVVLIGLGGIGKTEIVNAFVHSDIATSSFTNIFWTFAGSRAKVMKSFEDMAQALGISRPSSPVYHAEAAELAIPLNVRSVLDWLDDPANTGWLLVFDNFDDLESFQISEFFPKSPNGYIIITSRRQNASRLGKAIPIDVMSDAEALSLLYKSSQVPEPTQLDGATQLIKALGNLPLAIDQAGAYISEQSIDFETYLDMFKSSRMELLSQRPPEAVWSYKHTVYSTWEISFARIASASQLAIQLLRVAANFSSDDIPLDLVCKAAQPTELPFGCFLSQFFDFASPIGDYDHILQALPDVFIADRTAITTAIGLLISYSLVTRKAASTSLVMHPLIHSWLQHQVHSSTTRYETAHNTINLVTRAMFNACNLSKFAEVQVLYSHAFRCNMLIKSYAEIRDLIDFPRLAGCIVAIDAWVPLSVDFETLIVSDQFYAHLERLRHDDTWRIPTELWQIRRAYRLSSEGNREQSSLICEEYFRSFSPKSRYEKMYEACMAQMYGPSLFRRLSYARAEEVYGQTDAGCDQSGYMLARKDLVLGAIKIDTGKLDESEAHLLSCKEILLRRVGPEFFIWSVWHQLMALCRLAQGRPHDAAQVVWPQLSRRLKASSDKRLDLSFSDYELVEVYARALRAQGLCDEALQSVENVMQMTRSAQPPSSRALCELSLHICRLQALCDKSSKLARETGRVTIVTQFESILAQSQSAFERSSFAYAQEWTRGTWVFKFYPAIAADLQNRFQKAMQDDVGTDFDVIAATQLGKGLGANAPLFATEYSDILTSG